MISFPVISENYYAKSPFKFTLRQVPISHVPDGHYLVELEACGICHSDLLWLAHRTENWEKIGHEFGGKITHCGDNTSKFHEGQRVAVKNAAPCQRCDACKAGQPRSCHNIIVNKSGYDQYFLADERSLVNAEGLDAPLLGLVEPLGVAHEVVTTADIKPGDTVLVYGLGAIGLMAGRLCLQKGDVDVVGLARHPGRFSLAEQLGFTACFETDSPDLEKLIGQVSNGPCNKILLFAPPTCLNEAIMLLRPGGQIVVTGLNEGPWGNTIPFDFEQLIFKHASMKGAFACPNLFFEQSVQSLKNDGEIYNKIISRTEPLANLPQMMQDIYRSPRDHTKVVLMGHRLS